MPRRLPSQNKGGKLPDGSPAAAKNKKRNAGIAFCEEVIEAIEQLPQVQSGQWSKSYLVEQAVKSYLGLPTDYDRTDLELIFKGAVID